MITGSTSDRTKNTHMEFKQLNTDILMSKIEIFFEEITYSSKFMFFCDPSTTL